MTKYLGNQTTCDICTLPLNRFEVFYDGRLEGRTTWALMCEECHSLYGAGIGIGLGQMYSVETREKLVG